MVDKVFIVKNEWAKDFGKEIEEFFKNKFDNGAEPDHFLSVAANILADFALQFYDEEFALALAEVIRLRASNN